MTVACLFVVDLLVIEFELCFGGRNTSDQITRGAFQWTHLGSLLNFWWVSRSLSFWVPTVLWQLPRVCMTASLDPLVVRSVGRRIVIVEALHMMRTWHRNIISG